MSLRNILVANKNDLFCKSINTDDATVSGTVTYETGSELVANNGSTINFTNGPTINLVTDPFPVIPTYGPNGLGTALAGITVTCVKIGRMVTMLIPSFFISPAADTAGYFTLPIGDMNKGNGKNYTPSQDFICSCTVSNNDHYSAGSLTYVSANNSFLLRNLYDSAAPVAFTDGDFTGTTGLRQGLDRAGTTPWSLCIQYLSA